MAKSYNKVILLGNVGKVEIRTTSNSNTAASVSLATNDRYQDAQGNWQDRTEWHNLVAFKRTAEIIRDYVKKGSKIHIEGKLQTRSWDDRDSGKKVYRTEIIVNDLILLDGRSSDNSGSNGGSNDQKSNASANSDTNGGGGYDNAFASTEIQDDDIPF